jgi:hypothetical protein
MTLFGLLVVFRQKPLASPLSVKLVDLHFFPIEHDTGVSAALNVRIVFNWKKN